MIIAIIGLTLGSVKVEAISERQTSYVYMANLPSSEWEKEVIVHYDNEGLGIYFENGKEWYFQEDKYLLHLLEFEDYLQKLHPYAVYYRSIKEQETKLIDVLEGWEI